MSQGGKVGMMVGRYVALICGVAVLAGRVVIAEGSSERDAVLRAMQSWEAAVESGDFDELEKYYTRDAIYYPHNAEPVVGREAIMERNRRREAAADVEIVQRVDDLRIHHDWAIYSCLARISMTGRSTSVRHARVLLVMQRDDVDGRWRILRDIDNGTPETL